MVDSDDYDPDIEAELNRYLVGVPGVPVDVQVVLLPALPLPQTLEQMRASFDLNNQPAPGARTFVVSWDREYDTRMVGPVKRPRRG